MDSFQHNGQEIPADLNPQGFETIPDLLAHACRTHAQKPAFTSFGRTLSYAELDRLSAAFAVYLQRHTDLQPGDRIAIQLPNLIQYPVVLYGALRAGLVVVNTNPLYTAAEMEHQFRDSGAKALVIHKSMAHNADKIIGNTGVKHVFVTQVGDLHGFVKRTLLNAAVKYVKKMEPKFHLPGAIPLRKALLQHLGETPTHVVRKRGDMAVLQYTGGTTGVSKGAMLSHANLLSNMLQGCERIGGAGPDWAQTVISPLPLYHIYAFTIAQIVLACGGHSVLIPNPRDIPGFVKELRNWRPSAFLGLNTLFVALCNQASFRALDFSSLKVTVSGGMALTKAAAEQWQQVTGCDVMEGYGLTETSPAVSINPAGGVQVGSIGLPLVHTDVRITGPDGSEQPPETPGDLCVKGPQVMMGYWQRQRETRACFTDDGYLITGDIAVRQLDGYLRIVDRAKDLIIVSGFNVYPNEVEDAVTSHPDVLECAAIGVPDEVAGEAVKLVVVANRKDLTREEIRDWCRERLTRYKVPKIVEFVDELPKSNVGKVLRRMLKDDNNASAA
ncbi:AMP-binding protein [Marinobacterium arenosum]|uniref:AMP-binding protein n=1 Tax=Marinobacterium arenosum TaxID=2862496 RepID=UPI001C967945|nr:AMP-binding protein [Marinobacterium arenosum]MBY4677768.1 AMP-binding protein [Marinobacterium arenosum]